MELYGPDFKFSIVFSSSHLLLRKRIMETEELK